MKYNCVFMLLLCCIFTRAQEERKEVFTFEDAYKRRYNITKIDDNRQFRIDGKLDEEAWQNEGNGRRSSRR